MLTDAKKQFFNTAALGDMTPNKALEDVINEVKADDELNAALGGVLKQSNDQLKSTAEGTTELIGAKNLRYATEAYEAISAKAGDEYAIGSAIETYTTLMRADINDNQRKIREMAKPDATSTNEQKLEFLQAKVEQKLYAANENVVNAIATEMSNPEVIEEVSTRAKELAVIYDGKRSRDGKKVITEGRTTKIEAHMEKALAQAGMQESTDSAAQINSTYATDLLAQVTTTTTKDLRGNSEAMGKNKDRLYSLVQGNTQIKAYNNHVQLIETKATQNLQTINAAGEFKAQIAERKTVASRSSSAAPSRRGSATGDSLRVHTIKQSALSRESASTPSSPNISQRSSWKRTSASVVLPVNPRNPSPPADLKELVDAAKAQKAEESTKQAQTQVKK